MSDNVEILIGAQDNASSVINAVASRVGTFSTSFAALGPIAIGVGTALAGVTAAFISVNSAIDAVGESIATIDALTDTANGLGESVSKLQAFQFAMSEAGNVDAEKSIQALQKVQKVIGEVASGGGDVELFKKLGLDANQLSMQSPIDQFLALKQGIASVENTSERAAIAQQLLGKSAADLIPALLSQQEEFTASMQAASDLGVTVSEQGAAGVAAMNDAVGRVYAGFEGIANQVAVAVAPAVEAAALQIAEWLPPIVTLAEEYLPAVVDATVLLVGYTYDYASTLYKISTLDLVGAVNDMTDGVSTAQTMLNEVYAARDRAAATAIENAAKQEEAARNSVAFDEESLKKQEAKAAAAAKTVEQLERQLMVAQIGEDAVKKQEQLATATNDAERERIQLLQQQIDAQESMKSIIEEQNKAADEAAKAAQKEIADKAAAEQKKAEAIAKVQPGVSATESRLLTRGPSEKGLDKVASNTAKTVSKIDELIAAFREEQSPTIKLVEVN